MRLAFLVGALLVMIFALPSVAVTYFVAPDGSGQFATIQAAVNAAFNGDIIELGDGTFRGNGNRDVDYLGKSITIRSRSLDPVRCIIDCEGSSGTPHVGFRFGSGCTRQSVLQAVTVEHGYGQTGGGINVDMGNPTIRACVIRDNTSTGEGGGIRIWGGEPLVERCFITENTCLYGAGASASIGGMGHPAVFDHCVIAGNYGAYEGGGIRF